LIDLFQSTEREIAAVPFRLNR